MAFWEWGDPQASHVIVCVHGLSRQGRDFDVLAQALVARAAGPVRVVCPEVVGRGRSDWLKQPMGYQVPMYVSDMLAMLAQLHQRIAITRLDWLGTSMGGLIGMALCCRPELVAAASAATAPGEASAPLGASTGHLPVAIGRLVLNDVGPAIEWHGLRRIGTYLGDTGCYASLQEAAAHLRDMSVGFGPHTQAQWLALCKPMLKPLAQGGFTLAYDPAIAAPFHTVTEASAAQGEALMWTLYDTIRARTLLVRGAQSDVLTRETALEMTQRGPKARLVEFEGVGHAPTFIAGDQVDAVASFLLGRE